MHLPLGLRLQPWKHTSRSSASLWRAESHSQSGGEALRLCSSADARWTGLSCKAADLRQSCGRVIRCNDARRVRVSSQPQSRAKDTQDTRTKVAASPASLRTLPSSSQRGKMSPVDTSHRAPRRSLAVNAAQCAKILWKYFQRKASRSLFGRKSSSNIKFLCWKNGC